MQFSFELVQGRNINELWRQVTEFRTRNRRRSKTKPNLDIEIEAAMPQQQHIQESQQQFTQKSQEMFEPNAHNSEQISGQSVQLQSNEDHKINEGHTQDSIMEVHTKDEEKVILLPYTEQYSPNTNVDQGIQIVSHNKDSYDILNVDDDNVWPGEGEYDPMEDVVGRI